MDNFDFLWLGGIYTADTIFEMFVSRIVLQIEVIQGIFKVLLKVTFFIKDELQREILLRFLTQILVNT